MFNPILRELVNLQFELSQQWQRDCGIFELLLNLPPYGYIQKFMFFQFFCFFHTFLVIIGFKTQLPIYFAPSQMALLIFIVKLIIEFVKDMCFIMSDSFISFQRLWHGTYQIYRYEVQSEIEFNLFDKEILPIVFAIIYVLFFISVISFEYIIERSMQYMKYEYFITDTENYMREVFRRRFEKAQQQFYSDPTLIQNHTVAQNRTVIRDPTFNPEAQQQFYPYPAVIPNHTVIQYPTLNPGHSLTQAPHLLETSEVDVEME
uniref:Transmembrane protein n=1 Tax=Panagrolaimus sp. PS1159 TaxID=55785 RepID=A0AC35FHA7_9BILA